MNPNEIMVNVFGALMSYRIECNTHKGNFVDVPAGDAMNKLYESVKELDDAFLSGENASKIGILAADVANYAMMVFANTATMAMELPTGFKIPKG